MNRRKVVQMYKRMFIIFICLVPLFLLLNGWLGANTSNITKIAIYVLISGITIALVEFIRYNKRKNRKD